MSMSDGLAWGHGLDTLIYPIDESFFNSPEARLLGLDSFELG